MKRSVDLTHPAPLNPSQETELAALRILPDKDIDVTDIPELDDRFWANAIRNPFLRSVKQQLTLRLDADVVAWFKQQSPDGRGYQSEINKALRAHVLKQPRKTA